MHYSRAGLVALIFTLIVSLVSAVPIPATTESKLSSTLSPPSNPIPNASGQDLIQLDTAGTSGILLSGRMSTRPLATRLARRQQVPADMDDQLVRRSSIFTKIKDAFKSFGHKVKEGFQKAGKAIKSGFQKFGSVVKSGFQKAGSAIKSGFQKAGTAIKSGFQKVGNGIKTAAKKVWGFMKTTGAKVAKFGLKVVESVGEVVGKVVGFIPGIGKPIDRAIEGISKVAGVISDHIHVKLPPKLQKGMDVMDKADKIMGYIPRRREFSEEEAFQQRDIGETYHFEERDDIGLEKRDEYYFARDIYELYDLD